MKKVILLLLLFFLVVVIKAATPGASFAAKPQAGFTENKGQIVDQNHQQNKDVLFLLNGNGLNVQIRKGGFSYDTYTIERKAKEQTQDKYLPKNVKNVQDSFDFIYHYHRVDIDFENANKLPEVKRGKALLDYLNYYNVPNVPEGVVNVYSYKSILVKNIYPGIDIEYLVDAEKGFKYNFIVHPGADFHLIQMKYAGAESKLIENKIELSVDAGKLQEDIPQSWLAEDKGHLVNVGYKQIAKGVFGFEMDAPIASNKTLIIDPIPNVVWATYYGGLGYNYGYNCDVDATGNSLFSVYTNSTTSIATTGTHQVSLAGNYDICLTKFNASGVRLWGTYYGGIEFELNPKCVFDQSGNCYLAGYTASTTNISSVGSHQVSFGGSSDLFLAKFSSSGIRLWGTYFGGTAYEDNTGLAFDPTGNIILTGITGSTANISTVGAFQTSLAGDYDLFLAKFNTNGVRVWSTYFGGSMRESYPSCATDNVGNIILAGTSNTVGSGLSTSGAHQTTLSSGYDAIIVKFNSSGARLWSTYYGGTGEETFSSCNIDQIGNVLLLGQTTSSNGIATVGVHQTSNGGLEDCYLVKFNSSGLRLWGGYYGGSGSDNPGNIQTDPSGYIYISGASSSFSNMTTVGAYQATALGGGDGFFVKFNSSCIRQYGSYFGGSGNEYNLDCRVNSVGVIYLIGSTTSTGNIATSGAHQISLGGVSNAFFVKMSECLLGTIGAISPIGGANTCLGISKSFSVAAVSNAIGHQWTVPAGWLIQSGQGSTIITVIPNSTGTLTVKGYNGCGDSTTAASLAVTAITNATPSAITGSATPCYGVAATYSVTAVAGNTYEWVLPVSWGGSSSTNSILVNSFPTTAIGGDSIFVRAISTTTSCPSAYVKKRLDATRAPISPSVVYGINPACKTVATVFSVDSLPFANTYTWTFPTGWTIGTPATNRQITVTPSATAVAGNVTVKGTNTVCGAGPIYTKALLAPVVTPASPGLLVGPGNVCSGTVQTYTASTVAGISYYRWSVPADWTISSGQGTISLTVQVGTTSGNISVVAATNSGNSCESAPKTYAVYVNVAPEAASSISGPTEVCINGSYLFTCNAVANATGYTWTFPSGFSIVSGAGTNSIYLNTPSTLSANNQISVTALNGTCASPVTNYSFSGNNNLPVQPNPIVGNSVVCANSAQSYSVPSVASATSYTWTYPSTWYANGASNQNNISLTAGTVTGTISVKANNGACTSIARTFNVTNVNPSTNTPGLIAYSGVNCSGKTNTLSIAAVSGASSYVWTLPSGWSGSSTSNSIVVTPGIKSDTVMVAATNGTCSSLPRKQLITAYETPAQPGPITGASTICINSQNVYKINRQSNVSNYIWTWPSNYAVVSNADTAQTIVPNSSAASGNLSLVANNNGCQSTATLFPITINNTLPGTPGGIIGGTSICNGIPKTFSVGLIPNALSYKWSVPATWSIVSGQNTSQVSIRSDNSVGQITVKSVNGACESAAQSLNINMVFTPPSAPLISGDINPCLNQSAIFTVSNAAGAAVVWSAPVGWTISNQNQPSTNILIAGTSGTISAKINNGDCEGPAASMNIVANTVPAVSEIEGEKYVKANSVRIYTVKPSINTTYSWAVPTDWHLLSGNGTEKVAIMTGSSSGFITVYAQNNCGSSPPFNFSVYSSVSAGLDELALLGDIKVFPQPAKDHFNLSFTALQNLDQPKIVLIDMLGKSIFSRFEPNLRLGQIYEGKFSCEGLTPGIYFLQVQTSNATQTIKISINP